MASRALVEHGILGSEVELLDVLKSQVVVSDHDVITHLLDNGKVTQVTVLFIRQHISGHVVCVTGLVFDPEFEVGQFGHVFQIFQNLWGFWIFRDFLDFLC